MLSKNSLAAYFINDILRSSVRFQNMKLLLNSRLTIELISIFNIYTHQLFMIEIVSLLERLRIECHQCPTLDFNSLPHSCLFSKCRLFEKTFTPIVLREVASVSIVKLKFTSNNSGSAFLIIDHMKILMTSVCVCAAEVRQEMLDQKTVVAYHYYFQLAFTPYFCTLGLDMLL